MRFVHQPFLLFLLVAEHLSQALLISLEGDEDVFERGQFGEYATYLKSSGYAAASSRVCFFFRNVFTFVNNLSFVGVDYAGYKVKKGRFASAVRAYESDYGIWLDIEAAVIDG